MQNGFPYIDILIFGIIAVFLIVRLKNILGAKTGYQDNNLHKDNKNRSSSNVVSIKTNETKPEVDLSRKILEIDPTFDKENFLSGSRTFFEMVLNSFVTGNLDNVTEFIKPSVLNSFKNAINDRNSENETLIIDLKSIKKCEISDYKTSKTTIKISVFFESLQIKALLDSDDQLIDGNTDTEIVVKDIWIFERQINFKNPNWKLIETKSV